MPNPYLLAGGALAAGYALERGSEALRNKRQFSYPLVIDLSTLEAQTVGSQKVYAVNVRDGYEYRAHFPQLPFSHATIVANITDSALIEFDVNSVTYYLKDGQTLELENLAVRQFTIEIPSSVTLAAGDLLLTLFNKASATARAV